MDTKKDTNPKDVIGTSKVSMSCIPGQPLMQVALAMMEGQKYGRHNYRNAGVRHSVYYDAAFRHLMAWWEGQDTDPDSGLHHLSKAAACCFVALDSIMMGNDVDDRPVRHKDGLNIPVLNEKAKQIVESITNPIPPYTQLNRGIK